MRDRGEEQSWYDVPMQVFSLTALEYAGAGLLAPGTSSDGAASEVRGPGGSRAQRVAVPST